MFVDPEIAGDRLEDLEAGMIERRVELLERGLEARHLPRPDVLGHMVAKAVTGRKVPADVPEFLEIMSLRALGSLDPERRVTACSGAARNDIFALHVLGEGKEGLCLILGALDQLVRDGVVSDDRKAVVLEALAELPCKFVGVLLHLVERNRSDGIGSDRGHAAWL